MKIMLIISGLYLINALDAKVAVMFNTETYDTDEETGEEYLVARKEETCYSGWNTYMVCGSIKVI